MFLSISYKLGMILGCLIIFIFGMVVTTFWLLESQKSDAAIINLAGRQRMLTQKMSKETLEVQRGIEITKYRHELRKTAEIFDKSLKALMEGSEVSTNDDRIWVIPTTNETEIISQLKNVHSSWSKFHAAVRVVLSEDKESIAFNRAVGTIEAMSTPMLEQINQAVSMYEFAANLKISRLKNVLIGFLLASITLALIVLVLISKLIIQPIKQVAEQAQSVARVDITNLSEAVQAMAQGDLTMPIRTETKPMMIRSKDELGTMAQSLNGILKQTDSTIKAFWKTQSTLDELVKEIQSLITNAQNGNLNERGNSYKFQGVYGKLIQGINNLLNVIISPINEATSILERVAARDLTVRMTGDYKGDYAKIKESLNIAMDIVQKQILQEQELTIASEVQSNLLPKELPQVPRLEISAINIMAHPVGGDYYDFFVNPLGQLAFIIADVMGKGIPAALLMATVRAIWRDNIMIDTKSSDEILDALNKTFYLDLCCNNGRFVSAFSALYDPGTLTLEYSNGGHYPPLYLPYESDKFEEFDTDGMLIGIMSNSKYYAVQRVLNKGDLIVIYTDGIVEAIRKSELFGIERLKELIIQNRRYDVKEIQGKILSAVKEYTQGEPQSDDITLMVLRIASE